ncbi:MAG: hypothetical protein M3O89_11765 [Actinomycetota bacterium]|nr:hypothetical protein [Actinomycetota bacterium]
MRYLRRFVLLAAVAVGSAVLAGPAFGARPVLPFHLDTTHFVVHYQSDLQSPGTPTWAITQTTAGDIGALAERAYNAEVVKDGFPAPMSDGDGMTDIYVADLSASSALGLTIPDNPAGLTSSAYIVLDGSNPEVAFSQHVIAHEFFHTIQLATWLPANLSDYWLLEGTAEWMGYSADGYDTLFGGGPLYGPQDMALDCRDPLGTNMCDFNDYANNGYSRWPFFEYLTEKYGVAFVQDVFARGAAGATVTPSFTALDAISDALLARGTTVADTYNAWTQADLIGGYDIAALQNRQPPFYVNWQTGLGGDLGKVLVPVNHLSTRTVEFTRGDGDPSHLCYAAHLLLTVVMPAGTQSKPVFWWNASGNPPVPLTINGNTATLWIPWDTCTYAATRGFLSLPNASSDVTKVDAADFSVQAAVSIDVPKVIATPSGPPDPVGTVTPVIQVTAADVAPTLILFGPEILRLSPVDTQLRLIVESGSQGTVQAKLGTIVLGTASIRAGNNDVRFKLPAGMLRALRRSASAGRLLTLTPFSSNGTTMGQAVTRTVSVLAPKVKQRRK